MYKWKNNVMRNEQTPRDGRRGKLCNEQVKHYWSPVFAYFEKPVCVAEAPWSPDAVNLDLIKV